MIKKIIAASLLLSASLSQGHPAKSLTSKQLVITNVTIIDVTGAPAASYMTVVITGDRITDVGPTKSLRAPKDAQVVSGAGKYLIPGLWDMHVHWYLKDYLPLFLANGVTGIRQMWGMPMHHQWRKEQQSGSLFGPRMFIASPIVDGPNPIWQGSVSVTNEAQAREAVNKVRQDGADFIKIYTRLTRDAFFAIADETKKLGITFAGHVPQSVTVAEASDAGQKSIEHLTGILLACSSREDELRRELVSATSANPSQFSAPRLRQINRSTMETFSAEKASVLFALLKRNHTWQCPTLTVLRSGAFLADPSFRDDPRLKYMPSSVKTQWDPTKDFRFRNRTDEDNQISRVGFRKQMEIIRLMRQAGVEFIAGTDVLNPYCFPGFSLHDELALLVEAGLTPLEALQAATINAARYQSKEKELGTVEKGKIADLVLLDSNPLEKITNTQKINAVVINGKVINKAEIERMLQSIEAAAQR